MAIIRKGDEAAEADLRKAASYQSRQRKYDTHVGTLRAAGRMSPEKVSNIKLSKESDGKVSAFNKASGYDFTGPISGTATASVNPRLYRDSARRFLLGQFGSGVVKAGAVVKGGIGGIAQEMATKQRLKKRQQERNQNLSNGQFKGK